MNRPNLKIVTHDGAFHVDEIMAISLLKRFYCDVSNIVRTRDEASLKKALNDPDTLLVDVGLIDDSERLAFDHHQGNCDKFWSDVKGFDEPIPFSSTGLVFSFLIKEGLIQKHLDEFGIEFLKNRWIIPIDAHDNGLRMFEKIQVIGDFNKSDKSPAKSNKQFMKALSLMEMILDNAIENAQEHGKLVDDTIKCADGARKVVVDGKDYWVVTVSQGQYFLSTMAMNRKPELDFFIVERASGEFGVQTAPLNRDDPFSQKHSVPLSIRDAYENGEDLSALAGNGKVKFVHKAGFFSVINGTLDDALAFVKNIILTSS